MPRPFIAAKRVGRGILLDDAYAPGRDWINAMNKPSYLLAPPICSVGSVGLPNQVAPRPAFTSTCTPSVTNGTIRPVSFWRPVLDYYLDFEYNDKVEPVFQASRTHNSSQLYSMGNNIDAYTQAWLATGDQAYLITGLGVTEAILATARPNPELESQQNGLGVTYPDTRMSWETYGMSSLGFTIPAGQAHQNEAQLCKNILYMVAKAQQDPLVVGALATRIEAVRSWVEINLFEKWWHRGAPPGVPEDTGHMILEGINHFDGYSRWAMICMLLKQTCGNNSANLTNPANYASILTMSTKIVDGFTAITGNLRGLRPNMINHPNDPLSWWWHRFFDGTTTGTGDDTSHSNALVRYIENAVEFGQDGWTSADVDRLRYTFINELWDGDLADPQTTTYMNGGPYLNDWLQDGWFSLGRNNQAFAAIIQNKRTWTNNYHSQHYAHIMRNAHDLGFD